MNNEKRIKTFLRNAFIVKQLKMTANTGWIFFNMYQACYINKTAFLLTDCV